MRKVKKDRTATTSATISLVVHGVLLAALFVWAAKSGHLDPMLKVLNVVIVPKEAEKPKQPEEKPIVKNEPKPPPKTPEPPPNQPPPSEAPKESAPRPVAVVASDAPPAAASSLVDFGDATPTFDTSTNAPLTYYRSRVEQAFRANWNRPDGVADSRFVAEVQIMIDRAGKVLGHEWLRGSGDTRWDDSVRQALAATRVLRSAPPEGFPERFLVRFDVVESTESVW